MRAASLIPALFLAACAAPADTPAVGVARGAAALAAGQPRTARIHYLIALDAAPSDPAALLGLARAALASGDGVEAEAALTRAHASGADMAQALLLQGKPEPALAALRDAPPSAEASRLAAAAHLGLGHPAAAARAYDAALAYAGPGRPPASTRLLLDVAAFRFALRDVPRASAALNRALARNPRDAEALTLAAHFARTLAGPAASLPWLARAIAADPRAPAPRIARADALLLVGRARAALADTRAAHALSPDDPRALFIQAALAAEARRYPLARALLNRVGPRLDDRVGAPLLAARVDAGSGNRAQAAARLRALLAADPTDRPARALLAAIEARGT